MIHTEPKQIVNSEVFRRSNVVADGKKLYKFCVFEWVTIEGDSFVDFEGCWFQDCIIPFIHCNLFKDKNFLMSNVEVKSD